jgi:hypothetical protein
LPGDLDHAIFRIAAFTFWTLSSLAILSDYLGPDLHVNYVGAWAVAIWADIGGLVCWILAKRRAPLMLMLPLSLSGLLMITVAVFFTGGVQSHLWVLYVVPVIFTAALLESRLTAIDRNTGHCTTTSRGCRTEHSFTGGCGRRLPQPKPRAVRWGF